MKGSKQFYIGLMLSLLLAWLPAVVMAMTLQDAMANLASAKEQGLVGEQTNGYLGVVKDTGNVKQLASLINDARRAEYARLATSNGISQADVEAMAGQKAIERTQAGHFINLNGSWIKK
jgi:uncharacterized protein